MDLQSVLRLEETPLEGKFIHICEEEDQLGMFLLHHFIHLGIKRNAKILIIGIENSFGHYNGVGTKFGLNLLKIKGSGGVEFFDGLKVIDKTIQDDNGLFNYSAFKEELLSFLDTNAQHHSNTYVIIDKFSILQSLGVCPKEVITLTRAVQLRVRKYGCVLITRCRGKESNLEAVTETDNCEDPTDISSNILSHSASLNIIVRPLPTGKSTNVSGNLSFLWATEKNWSRYQFRIEEKDVRIFAKGTSSAVL